MELSYEEIINLYYNLFRFYNETNTKMTNQELDILKRVIKDDKCLPFVLIDQIKLSKYCRYYMAYLYNLKEINVARNIEEINYNTLMYVNNLSIIEEEAETYNLKYIYGTLIYRPSKVVNLENLELISKSAYFRNIKTAEGLENLTCIGEDAVFPNLLDVSNLVSLKYIGKIANFEKVEQGKLDPELYVGEKIIIEDEQYIKKMNYKN